MRLTSRHIDAFAIERGTMEAEVLIGTIVRVEVITYLGKYFINGK
jgi:hypothetical protein